jgi:Kef-type K+ transport system membrane component KefB
MKRTFLIYTVMLLVFGAGMYVVLERGRHLVPPAGAGDATATSIASAAPVHESGSFWSGLRENVKGPLSRLLLQVVVIVLATRVVGALYVRCRQPSVVGEVLAGILLGPSLFGWLWPGAWQFIFPSESLGELRLLSQIGVCVFMFVVGMELDLGHVRDKAHATLLVSHASIAIPYLLGAVAALFLYSDHAAPGASFLAFALFMGIALSITAFPVLARILAERGMNKTVLGTMALACAAVNDATAWVILAGVVAIARASGMASTMVCLGLVALFVALMLWVVRPGLPRWLGLERMAGSEPGRAVVGAVLVLMIASSLVAEVLGLHALFGAFLAGVVMPRQKEFYDYLVVRLEDFAALFLLPLFFAFSGLRTHVGLLNDTTSWLVCFAIIGIATIGKLGGTMFTARLTGMNWNDSFALGALMNTRGLVELVALNIGYDLGILPPRIFAMMVLMALVTTFMTGPLLNLAERAKRQTATATHTQ